MKITVFNRGPEDAPLHILPNIWFRNTWDWGYSADKPSLERMTDNSIFVQHQVLGKRILYADDPGQVLFCDNESNCEKLYSIPNKKDSYYKDGINDYIIHGANTVNPGQSGTKAAFHFNKMISAGKSETVRIRLSSRKHRKTIRRF